MTDSATSDLWRRWRRARDGDAFAALVAAELPRAVAVARGTGCDASAAEDAVQDALVALAGETTDAPLAVGVRAWLFRAVRDRARSGLRAGRRRRRRESQAARPEAAAPRTPERETVDLVERALALLDDGAREAVRLRHALDLDYREVAAVLGTSEGAARVRVHRALEKLRERLGRDPATLLALLPLPAAAATEGWVSAALGKAAAATAAASAATSAATAGGAAMATTKATVLATAAVAFTIGAALTGLTAATLDDDGADLGAATGGSARADRAPRSSTAASTHATRARDANDGDASWLDDLAVLDDERSWVRDFIVRERERRTEGAIRASDGGLDVVRRWLEHGADIEPVVASFATMAAHVRDPSGPVARVEARVEANGEATTVDMGAVAAAAGSATIEFGAGRFVVDGGRAQWGGNVRAPVEALEIRGAGLDRTTLVAPARLFACYGDRGDLRNVVIRDVTIECGDNLLCAFGAASVRLERVRVRASRTAPLYVSGAAFVACVGCEFESPEGEFAAALRGPSIVVFEGCRFSGGAAVLAAGGARSGGRESVVRCVDCRFEDVRVADSRIRGGRLREVDLRVRGGEVLLSPPRWSDDERRTWWGGEHAAAVEHVRFAALAPRLTLGGVLRAIDAAANAGWARVVGVELQSGGRDDTPVLAIWSVTDDGKSVVGRVARLVNGALVVVPRVEPTKDRSSAIESAKALDGILPLAELVRRSGIAEDEPVSWAGFSGVATFDGARVPYAVIEASPGARVAVEGRTGTRLGAW